MTTDSAGSSHTEVDLSEEQRRLVDHGVGPLLVVAGPGSGKTRVLAERFVRLVGENLASPDEVLVLAYNSDAAWEMLRRIRERIGYGDYPIYTFHAFARRVMSELGWLAGLPTAFRLVTERVEQWQRLESVVMALRPSYFYPPQARRDLRLLQNFIGRAKQEGVPPDRILHWAETQRNGTGDANDRTAELYSQAGSVYDALEKLYSKDSLFDFDDLIQKLADALGSSYALRGAISARYRFVMVDEYQDTNFTQALMLERMVGEPFNVLAVADDDQSIYKFRGASLANITRFKRTYAGAPVIALGRNYRSTGRIVAVSSKFIELSTVREAKPFKTHRPEGTPVTVVTAPDLLSEAKWVADSCRRLLSSGLSPSDIAILARTNAQLVPFVHALADLGIPYEVSGGGDFFVRPEIKDLVAIVRVAVDPYDDLGWVRLLKVPAYRVSSSSRLNLVQWLRQTGQHALNVDSDSMLPEDRAAFTNLRLDVESLGDMALTSSAREVVHSAMERSRHVGVLDLEHPLDQLEAAANVRKFADLVARFDADHPGGDSRAFLSYLDLAAQADSEQADIPREITPIAVRASTVHSAKGLEFAHVFVVNLAEHRFPLESRERLLDVPAVLVEEELAAATSLDEERRLFYVAITRAMDGLTVTYAQRYNTWAREPVSPSQFLEELRRLAGEQLREMTAEQAMLPADAVTRPPRGVAEATSAFSYSQLQTFSDCPRRFSYEFEFHLPQRETRELALGNLTHHALEQAARQRLNGSTPTDQDIRAHIEEAWKAATFDKAAWPELEQVAGEIVLRYMSTTGWSDAQLSEVERDFSYDDPPFVFSGRIDRLDLREGRPVIVDYKSGRPRTLEAVQKDFRLGRQFGMYRLGARQLLSTARLDAEVHFIAGGDAIRIDQDEDQLERHRRWAWAVAKSIGEARRTRNYPVNPNDFNCPNCPFRLVCDEGQEFLRAK